MRVENPIILVIQLIEYAYSFSPGNTAYDIITYILGWLIQLSILVGIYYSFIIFPKGVLYNLFKNYKFNKKEVSCIESIHVVEDSELSNEFIYMYCNNTKIVTSMPLNNLLDDITDYFYSKFTIKTLDVLIAANNYPLAIKINTEAYALLILYKNIKNCIHKNMPITIIHNDLFIIVSGLIPSNYRYINTVYVFINNIIVTNSPLTEDIIILDVRRDSVEI